MQSCFSLLQSGDVILTYVTAEGKPIPDQKKRLSKFAVFIDKYDLAQIDLYVDQWPKREMHLCADHDETFVVSYVQAIVNQYYIEATRPSIRVRLSPSEGVFVVAKHAKGKFQYPIGGKVFTTDKTKDIPAKAFEVAKVDMKPFEKKIDHRVIIVKVTSHPESINPFWHLRYIKEDNTDEVPSCKLEYKVREATIGGTKYRCSIPFVQNAVPLAAGSEITLPKTGKRAPEDEASGSAPKAKARKAK